jgi:hypothetical protein
MLGPLRDLLGRPAFGQLVGINQQSVMVGARDALLLDLANTYNPLMVTRLAAVIDGCLGLPPGSVPSVSPAGTRGAAPQQVLQGGAGLLPLQCRSTAVRSHPHLLLFLSRRLSRS